MFFHKDVKELTHCIDPSESSFPRSCMELHHPAGVVVSHSPDSTRHGDDKR